jgi:hypothetical protein
MRKRRGGFVRANNNLRKNDLDENKFQALLNVHTLHTAYMPNSRYPHRARTNMIRSTRFPFLLITPPTLRYGTLCYVHDRWSELLIHTTDESLFKRERTARRWKRETELGWELLRVGRSVGRGVVERDDGRRCATWWRWWRWFERLCYAWQVSDCRTASNQKSQNFLSPNVRRCFGGFAT